MIIFSSIAVYSTASTSEAAYIIGGGDNRDNIAEFRNNSWRKIGSLTEGRYGHGSIALNDKTFVIGGWVNDYEK